MMDLVSLEYLKAGLSSTQDATVAMTTARVALGKRYSIQPPSAFSKMVSYALIDSRPETFVSEKHGRQITFEGQNSKWEVRHNLDEAAIAAATKGWSDDMFRSRSRVATIAGGPHLVTEMNYKIALSREFQMKLPELKGDLEFELFMKMLHEIKAALTLSNFDKFVTEHKKSSVKPGLRWPDLTSEHAQQLKDYWSGALSHYIELGEEMNTTYWNQPYYIGMRARTTTPFVPGQSKYIVDVSRTRMVAFEPHQSTLFSVLDPDRFKQIKKNMMTKWRSDTGLQAYQAYTDGVDVYTKMDELKHYPYRAWDGMSWETFVPRLIPFCNPFTTPYADDVSALATGNWGTTIFGIFAALRLFRNTASDTDVLIGNSDDMNHIFTDGKPREVVLPLDESVDDTNLKFMLGIAYNAENPHPIGVKLTSDKSDLHSQFQEPMTTEFRTLSDVEIGIVAEVYQGRVNGMSWIEYLKLNAKELEDVDYFSPSELIDTIVQKEVKKDE